MQQLKYIYYTFGSKIKSFVLRTIVTLRAMFNYNGVLPNFLIIGAQKAGTTSLFNYLLKHPDIVDPLQKEINFFDKYYKKGLKWYKCWFPKKRKMINKIVGESCPDYFFNPKVPERVANCLPQIKLIVLLRNPVHRTISHYFHNKKWHFNSEQLSLEERVNKEIEMIKSNQSYENQEKSTLYSYLHRSIYVTQLERWFKYFDRKKILIINSEYFYKNPTETYKTVLEFLNVKPYTLSEFKKFNVGEYGNINQTIINKLEIFFNNYNEKLYELLNERYDW